MTGSTSSTSPREFDIPGGFSVAEFQIRVGAGGVGETASKSIDI